MAREILAHIKCPHCGNNHATVHKQAKGSRALYYRCYPENGDPCGTVQIILKGGQKFINENMRPLNQVEQNIAAADAGENAKVEQLKAAEKIAAKTPVAEKPKGMFSSFLEDSMA